MESHSNDSRDSGHHWWNSSYSYITAYHRSTVLLQAAGEAPVLHSGSVTLLTAFSLFSFQSCR